MASKIIVVGEVNGQVSDVFSKLQKLHMKNAFAFAIIAGNLFADPTTASEQANQEVVELLQGSIAIPLPTYFALGTRALPEAVIQRLADRQGELCPNLTILGRKIMVKTSEGIKLAAIGGAYNETSDETTDEHSATYNDKYIDSAKNFKDIDILVTSEWPAAVKDGSKAQYFGESAPGINSISDLCATLKPRYHFSTSAAIYEREPFFHPGPTPRAITRFISLAPLNNPKKYKALYAFSCEPSVPPTVRIEDCTASPFVGSTYRKRKLDGENGQENGFRFAQDNSGSYQHREHRRHKRRKEERDSECYFCLAGKNVEAHMITSIGENVYMTIAKGPLTTNKNFPSLQHPLHMLIIPLQHQPTIAAIPDDESRNATLAEMHRYREALHSMIASKSTSGADGEANLGAVTWEISRAGGVHVHWQFLPVPVDMIQRGLIEAAFEVEAENLSYPKFTKKASDLAEAEKGDYFKAMIWSESMQKEIVLPLEKGMRFDLQFGRRVLGKLLGLESRTHWRDCGQTQPEEAADAERFKAMFRQYDFALEE